MKLLNRIVLVNWYLFSRLEIEIRGNTAIVGPNASGKSSLLDAIQTVLTGGDKRYLSLNASTDGKSYRSVREYCLGFMYDPADAEGYHTELRPREHALSYLALSFRDTESGDETCVGLAISASLADPNERVEARFIIPGLSVSLAEFIKETPQGELPRPWNEVRDQLGRRFPTMEVETRPELYVRKVLAMLSADAANPIDHQKFLKNFRSAVTFVPIKDPTEFVRRYVLDQRIIPVAELRSALKNYRFLSERTATVQKRIDSLKQIARLCDEVAEQRQHLTDFAWIEHEAAFSLLDGQASPLRQELMTLDNRLMDLTSRESEVTQASEAAANTLALLRIELQTSDTAAVIATLEAESRNAEQRVAITQQGIAAARQILAGLATMDEGRDHLTAGLIPIVQEGVALLAGSDDLMAGMWPADPAAVDVTLNRLRLTVPAERDEIHDAYEEAVRQEVEFKRSRERLQRDIETLNSGSAPLSGRTRELLRLLEQQGIVATPLCDLIDVNPQEERWRTAIESYLGGQREGLVVAPEQARDAVRIFRHEGKHLKGCRIINSQQTERWLDRCEKGSLGELIVTNDPHARAYTNRILGQVIRVESEGELLKHERAMTADCMLHANGAVTSIREEEPILGGDSRRRTMLLRSEELAALSTAAADLQLRKQSLATLDRLVSRLHDQLSLPGESLSQLVDQREKSRLHQQELQERMYALKNREDGGLKERIARIESESQRLRGELRRLQLDGQEARDRRIALATRLQILDEQGSFHADRRKEAASDPLFLLERAQEKLQRLANRFSADFRRVADESARRKGEALETAARRREQVLAAVSEHQSLYHGTGNIRELVSDQEVAASYDSLEEYVRRSLRDLEDSRLAEYREQADLALRAAEVAFRSEFVSQLQDQFARSRETIRELNQHLKNRPFHGEYYTFHQTPNPLLGDLYRFITESTPEEQQNVGTLFDSALAPDSPQRQAVERISRALQDEAESRLLEDYREYFIFEVKMHDAEGRLRASLSQRIKKGSGGENQAPFYVAIGAALASTYRIREAQEGTLTGGAALVLFDEAFSKLDVQNTLNCLSFLRDIHLQVVLCAPDEKYGLMSEMMDTIVNICRDGAAVEVDVEYPGVAGRELLTRDNPYRQQAVAPILSTAPALGG